MDSSTTDPEAPRIDFPCLYPIKIIGRASADFESTVVGVVERHTGKISDDLIKHQTSKNDNYISVTVTIAATGEEQLRHIFEELKTVPEVKMVL